MHGQGGARNSALEEPCVPPYPVVLDGPPAFAADPAAERTLYAWLIQLHTVLAYLFFLTFLAHFGAALLNGLVRRDGVFESMALFGRSSPRRP
jgi:cytochrome b561